MQCKLRLLCEWLIGWLYGVAKMPFVFSHVAYCDMHFVYGFCDGNARAAVQEYQRRFPDGRIPSRSVFTRIHQTLRDTGSLPSVSLQSERRWYERLTHERTFFRWFREFRTCLLVEWPLASAYHVCRCGELYMWKICILTMIKGYNFWNQATMLSVWICATG